MGSTREDYAAMTPEENLAESEKRSNSGYTRWTNEEILEALRLADEANGGPIGGTDYGMRYRKFDFDAPSGRTVWMRFGSWNEAREAAGLPINTERPGTAGKRWRVPEQQVIDAVTECALDLGHLPSYSEYMEWRDAEPENRKGRKGGSPPGTLPCGSSARQLVGSWLEVKRRVLFELRTKWGWD